MLPKLGRFIDGQPLDNHTLLEDTTLQFIPISILQQGIYKPFYAGYRAAFHAIRRFLTDPNAVPSVQRLRQELALGARTGVYESTPVEYFLERGGSVKYALDMVVHLAACLSTTHLGDGSFDRKWDTMTFAPETQPAGAGSSRSQSLSPFLGTSPMLKSSATSDGITLPSSSALENQVKRRRRSSSFRELLTQFGRRDRKSWMLDIKEDESIERQRRYKEEWDASGEPGCALDDQFVGVRYLMGLHSTPRWDIDGQDRTARREDCQLRRM